MSKPDPQLPAIPETELTGITGGMKWQGGRESLNVEDRRPGAPSLKQQRLDTIRRNRANGFPE